jgi:hypothetical protein
MIGNKEKGIFKIGKADDPDTRLRDLTTGCPYSIEVIKTWAMGDSSFDAEILIHDYLEPCRLAGEWFALHHEIFEKTVTFIEGVYNRTPQGRLALREENRRRKHTLLKRKVGTMKITKGSGLEFIKSVESLTNEFQAVKNELTEIKEENNAIKSQALNMSNLHASKIEYSLKTSPHSDVLEKYKTSPHFEALEGVRPNFVRDNNIERYFELRGSGDTPSKACKTMFGGGKYSKANQWLKEVYGLIAKVD